MKLLLRRYSYNRADEDPYSDDLNKALPYETLATLHCQLLYLPGLLGMVECEDRTSTK